MNDRKLDQAQLRTLLESTFADGYAAGESGQPRSQEYFDKLVLLFAAPPAPLTTAGTSVEVRQLLDAARTAHRHLGEGNVGWSRTTMDTLEAAMAPFRFVSGHTPNRELIALIAAARGAEWVLRSGSTINAGQRMETQQALWSALTAYAGVDVPEAAPAPSTDDTITLLEKRLADEGLLHMDMRGRYVQLAGSILPKEPELRYEQIEAQHVQLCSAAHAVQKRVEVLEQHIERREKKLAEYSLLIGKLVHSYIDLASTAHAPERCVIHGTLDLEHIDLIHGAVTDAVRDIRRRLDRTVDGMSAGIDRRNTRILQLERAYSELVGVLRIGAVRNRDATLQNEQFDKQHVEICREVGRLLTGATLRGNIGIAERFYRELVSAAQGYELVEPSSLADIAHNHTELVKSVAGLRRRSEKLVSFYDALASAVLGPNAKPAMRIEKYPEDHPKLVAYAERQRTAAAGSTNVEMERGAIRARYMQLAGAVAGRRVDAAEAQGALHFELVKHAEKHRQSIAPERSGRPGVVSALRRLATALPEDARLRCTGRNTLEELADAVVGEAIVIVNAKQAERNAFYKQQAMHPLHSTRAKVPMPEVWPQPVRSWLASLANMSDALLLDVVRGLSKAALADEIIRERGVTAPDVLDLDQLIGRVATVRVPTPGRGRMHFFSVDPKCPRAFDQKLAEALLGPEAGATTFSFAEALMRLRQGKRVRRSAWANMSGVRLVPKGHFREHPGLREHLRLAYRDADGTAWVPTSEDLLAIDWSELAAEAPVPAPAPPPPIPFDFNEATRRMIAGKRVCRNAWVRVTHKDTFEAGRAVMREQSIHMTPGEPRHVVDSNGNTSHFTDRDLTATDWFEVE
jgi:hypothetical protein